MHSGRRTLHWNTPEPGHVHRHHEHPDTSDNYGMIHRIADEPIGDDGIRAGDFNLQAWWSTKLLGWVVGGAHWRDPARNGYTRMKRRIRPGTRQMTHDELHRTVWTWEEVQRWRRPNGEQVRTYEELITAAVLAGVVVIGEEKHRALHHPAVARALVAAARRHDHPAWFMVLDDHEPRDKVAAMRAAGGQIALIFGTDGVQKPRDWARWAAYPNQIWGPASAKRWLPS